MDPIDENRFSMDTIDENRFSMDPIDENRFSMDPIDENRFSWIPIDGKSIPIDGKTMENRWRSMGPQPGIAIVFAADSCFEIHGSILYLTSFPSYIKRPDLLCAVSCLALSIFWNFRLKRLFNPSLPHVSCQEKFRLRRVTTLQPCNRTADRPFGALKTF